MTEPIAVIFLTYDNGDGVRTEYALRAIQALKANLVYPDLRYYLADDGSPQSHVDKLLAELQDVNLIGWHTLPNGSYGRNVNEAMNVVMPVTNLYLVIEDDWELTEPLELYRYAALLMEQQEIGLVRLGYLNLNMRGLVVGYAGALYWKLDRDCDSYVFTGHPSLRHSRYFSQYGRYPEGLSPGETELMYALQYRTGNGCDIAWPVMNGEYGKFAHIGQVKATY